MPADLKQIVDPSPRGDRTAPVWARWRSLTNHRAAAGVECDLRHKTCIDGLTRWLLLCQSFNSTWTTSRTEWERLVKFRDRPISLLFCFGSICH